MRTRSHLLSLVLGAAACAGSSQPPEPAATPAAATAVAATPASAPASAPAAGTVIGQFRENHFGTWKEWQPVRVGAAVRFTPEDGWATREEAEAALAQLAATSPGRPSSVAVLAVGDRFVARYLENKDGGDLRPWHVPHETRPENAQWIATVDGPAMVVRVSAQAQSQDWCQTYIQGSWGAVPATSDSFKPASDPKLLDVLYKRRTRFDGDQVHEWAAGGKASTVKAGTATFATDKSTCRVTVSVGGGTEAREYLPESDDAMHLVIQGSSSPLYMKRLTGDDALPPK